MYNVEKYIRCCIESVLHQTYLDLEVILVDDGSTDLSGVICDEYARTSDRIKTYHKSNGGLSDARNYGIKYASGEWITFLDSDDIWHPNFVRDLLLFACGNDLDIAVSNYCKFSEKQLDLKFKIKNGEKTKIWNGEEGLKELLYQKTFTTSAWAKLYKTKMLENIMFPLDRLHEDVGTIYKIFERAKRIGYIEAKLYFYLQRSTSIIHSEFSSRKMDYIILTQEMVQYFETNNKKIVPAAISRHFSACFQVIAQCPASEKWHEEYVFLLKQIKKYAPEVMKDTQARRRNRYIARIATINVKWAVILCKLIYG